MGFVIIWLVAAIVAGILANNKNRSVIGWGISTLIIPLLVFIVLVLPTIKEDTPSYDLKKCPFCAEDIKAEAVICKHCQRDIPPQQPTLNTNSQQPDTWPRELK